MIYIGTDIEDVKRFERLKKIKPNLLTKLFSQQELEYAGSKSNTQSFTGIWCAKEAVVKAFSSIKVLDIRNIHIGRHKDGAPFVCKIVNFNFESQYKVSLSISHTANYATAVCLVQLVD